MKIVSNLEVEPDAIVGPIRVELEATREGEAPKLELAGIGAQLEGVDDGLLIKMVVPGGGAEAAGLVVGDVLLAVDGATVLELGFDGAIQRIRGPEGTTVRLAVRRAAGGRVVDVVAERRKIRM
jgi:C-terminal processing protease CtpA/Prc